MTEALHLRRLPLQLALPMPGQDEQRRHARLLAHLGDAMAADRVTSVVRDQFFRSPGGDRPALVGYPRDAGAAIRVRPEALVTDNAALLLAAPPSGRHAGAHGVSMRCAC